MKEAVILQRIEKVQEQMAEQGVDAFFLLKDEEVTDVDFLYLFGFSGSLAFAVITQEKAVLIVDPRYTEQAGRQSRGVEIVEINKGREQLLAELLPQAFGDAKRVGLMAEQLIPVGFYNELKERFPGVEFVTMPAIARTGRVIKDEGEIRGIRRSVGATEEALRHAFSV